MSLPHPLPSRAHTRSTAQIRPSRLALLAVALIALIALLSRPGAAHRTDRVHIFRSSQSLTLTRPPDFVERLIVDIDVHDRFGAGRHRVSLRISGLVVNSDDRVIDSIHQPQADRNLVKVLADHIHQSNQFRARGTDLAPVAAHMLRRGNFQQTRLTPLAIMVTAMWIALISIAAYLFALLVRSLWRNDRYARALRLIAAGKCPDCRYDISATSSPVCPECSLNIDAIRSHPSTITTRP